MPAAATLGHFHICPKVNPGPVPHVGGPIAVGSTNVLICGMPAARVGDMAICVGPPDKIAKGSSSVIINNKPAARMGDRTAHGGMIVSGMPNVLIGDSASSGSFSMPSGSGSFSSAPQKPASNFTGQYKGQQVEMQGVEVRQIEYTKRPDGEREQLRQEFDPARKKFIQDMAGDPEKVEQLKKAGIGDTSIRKMQQGKVPQGWQVHHKLPLDDGGNNAEGNFVLIHSAPAHSALTTYQKQNTGTMKAGETKTLDWPIPPGTIYPAHPDMVKITGKPVGKPRKQLP